MSATEFTPRRRAKDCIYWVAGNYDTTKDNKVKGQVNTLVVSKDRASKHSEIYTPKCAVDFIWESSIFASKKKSELNGEYFDKYQFIAYVNILDPFCGNGNFPETIIRDKLKAIFKSIREQGFDLRQLRYSGDAFMLMILSVSSLYALDLQSDNVIITRNRIFYFVSKTFKKVYGRQIKISEAKLFCYLLRMQIQHADTMSCEYPFLFFKNDDTKVYYYFRQWTGLCWKVRDKNGWWIEYARTIKDIIEPNYKKEDGTWDYKKINSKKKGSFKDLYPDFMGIDLDNPPADKKIDYFVGDFQNINEIYQTYLQVYFEIEKNQSKKSFTRYGFVDLRTQQSGYEIYLKRSKNV